MSMTEDEKYLFDLNGYLVVRDVLTAKEIRTANDSIDHHADQIQERVGDQSLSGESKTLKGITGRGDLGGLFGWDSPWGDPFRALIAHPRIVPYLNVILGSGFRMDHNGGLITMRKCAEGHLLHGSSGPGFDPHQYYLFKNGQMHNGLTVVVWQFSDVNQGDGGLCIIPGSHKGNYPCPQSMRQYEAYQEFVKPITCKAGDVVIFTEAATHGTLPWQADHQRRSFLLRFSPGNLAYAKGYLPDWPENILSKLTAEQRAVFEPPYHKRLDRPTLDDNGALAEN